MVDVKEMSQLYAAKLLETGDHQAAFLKAVWVAYQRGLKDATENNVEKVVDK